MNNSYFIFNLIIEFFSLLMMPTLQAIVLDPIAPQRYSCNKLDTGKGFNAAVGHGVLLKASNPYDRATDPVQAPRDRVPLRERPRHPIYFNSRRKDRREALGAAA